MRANENYTDFMNVKRKTGEEWLITMKDAESHICDVHEEVGFWCI